MRKFKVNCQIIIEGEKWEKKKNNLNDEKSQSKMYKVSIYPFRTGRFFLTGPPLKS